MELITNGEYLLLLSDDLSRPIKRDLENSKDLEDTNPEDYPFDIYLNGDQYNAWLDQWLNIYTLCLV